MMHKRPLSLIRKGCQWLALALLLGLSGLIVDAAVTISEFKATPQPDGSILVSWETATELDTQAFNLYRALSDSGPWDQLVDQQEAEGDNITGATYQYLDTDVASGVRYYYLLEELTSSGPGQRVGPVNAGIGLEAEPTNTATAPATLAPTTTPTATRTPTATAAPTATATATLPGGSAPQATATRQFTNTPTTAPTVTPGLEPTWTPAPTATATPLPAPQVATPTPAGGMPDAATTVIPASTQVVTELTQQPASTEDPLAASTPAPEQTPAPIAPTPNGAATPSVFVQATNAPALLDAPTRLSPEPTPVASEGRNTRLVLLLGGGAIALAGLLGVAGVLIWRASRSRGEGS